MHVEPCKGRDDDCCRRDEAGSRNEQSPPSGTQVANMYGQFA